MPAAFPTPTTCEIPHATATRMIRTLTEAIARRSETLVRMKRSLKRAKVGERAGWAMGCADCEADIEHMKQLAHALTCITITVTR